MCQSRNVGQGTSSAKFCHMIKQTGSDSFTTHNPQLYHLRAGRERKYLRALGAPSWSTWLREPVQLGWPGLRHLQGLVLRWSVWSVTQFHDSWCTQPCRQSCQSPCPFASHMVYGPTRMRAARILQFCVLCQRHLYVRWSAQLPRPETCPAASALPAGQEVLGAAPKTHEAHGLRGLRRLSKSKHFRIRENFRMDSPSTFLIFAPWWIWTSW